MKRVLMIAYYFPPIGGPGTQRSLKYVKYLRRFGWEPIVIAGIEPSEHQDPELLKDIPEGVEVHRIALPRTPWRTLRRLLFDHHLGRLGGFLGHWLDFPETRREWAEHAADLAVKMHREHPFDLLYTTSYPYSPHYVGVRIKRTLGVAWVADFREPWAGYELDLGPLPKWVERKHMTAERAVARSADALTFAQPTVARDLCTRHCLNSARCATITNGYDPDDFALGERSFPPIEGSVRIVHTGSFYRAYSPHQFMDALADHWAEWRHDSPRIEMRFVGGVGDYEVKQIPGIKVSVLPRVTHPEAIEEQRQAHILLVTFDRRVFSGNIPGKLFEYLRWGKPILAVVPSDGGTAAIVRECEAGWVVDCDRPEEIANTVQSAVHTVMQADFTFKPNWSEIQKYSRVRLTKRLARLFDKVTA